MAKTDLMPKDRVVADAVRAVLLKAAKGKGTVPNFLTAYQILNRLPAGLRAQLIAERERGGKGSKKRYAAPSVVSDAVEMLPGIVIEYLDTRGLQLLIEGQDITPGNNVCGLYRLK